MNAPLPKNEGRRLKVLWQYDILDTLPEEAFDELADLARILCGAPIALITLVDEDRQWFKSKRGVNVKESSRDVSLCAHAILQKGLLIVPDATKDKRFKNNPFIVAGPKIRFYAGAPLISPTGYALGTLCVIDKVPRQLTAEQKRALRILSKHVMTQLDLRYHTRELAKAKAEIIRLNQPAKAPKPRR